jgi:hypothetical protein
MWIRLFRAPPVSRDAQRSAFFVRLKTRSIARGGSPGKGTGNPRDRPVLNGYPIFPTSFTSLLNVWSW